MRNLRVLDCYRTAHPFDGDGSTAALEGAFKVGHLNVIACNGEGWDHVSVSRPDRIPTWDEMEKIKRMFFKEDETVMQLHVPPSRHINCHPHVLHLWRPHEGAIPLPPEWMV